ncbi:myb-like protein X [Xenia sp. Carnegie-2017]|uniref:myb-like protein X n=1 Tax=Xenia sp. Carnegie-2017 TaxID=2897299 RepID=UPI001F04A33F|nr:myb-like protein X [Xenia sp. Carnegie-2017]
MLIKCNDSIICAGINRGFQDAPRQQLTRKLLTLQTDSADYNVDPQLYWTFLCIATFCIFIILIVLCAKSRKNSKGNVAYNSHDGNVTILSSQIVTSTDTNSNQTIAPLPNSDAADTSKVDGSVVEKTQENVMENKEEDHQIMKSKHVSISIDQGRSNNDSETENSKRKIVRRIHHQHKNNDHSNKTVLPKTFSQRIRPSLKKKQGTKVYQPKEKNASNSSITSHDNRHSIVNRELPKTPSHEHSSDLGKKMTRLNVPVGDDNDSGHYDSVDDSLKVRDDNYEEGYNAYESVTPKEVLVTQGVAIKPNTTPYESVDISEYEEPNIFRNRSFSDLPKSSTPRLVTTETKSVTLHSPQNSASKLPPYENHHIVNNDYDDNDIQPYTTSFKKGDLIIQEVSTSTQTKPDRNVSNRKLSPEEIEQLYTKVDMKKKKRDREEAQLTKRNEEEENNDRTFEKTLSLEVSKDQQALANVTENKSKDSSQESAHEIKNDSLSHEIAPKNGNESFFQENAPKNENEAFFKENVPENENEHFSQENAPENENEHFSQENAPENENEHFSQENAPENENEHFSQENAPENGNEGLSQENAPENRNFSQEKNYSHDESPLYEEVIPKQDVEDKK